MNYRITKKSCLDLIAEKSLPYNIKNISGTFRLIPTTPGEDGVVTSIPIFSWIRLYEFLRLV